MLLSPACEGKPSLFGKWTAIVLAGLCVPGMLIPSLCGTAQAKPAHHRSHSTPPAKVKTVRAATVRVSTAYLRVGPNENKGGRALLDKGRAAKVVGEKGDWLRLRLESGTEGWVRADLLKVKEKQFKIAQAAPKAKKVLKKSVKVAKAKPAKAIKVAVHHVAKPAKSAPHVKPVVVAATHPKTTIATMDRASRFDRAAQARIALRASLAQPHDGLVTTPANEEVATLPTRTLMAHEAPVVARNLDLEEVGSDAPTEDVPTIVRKAVAEARPQYDNNRGERRARTALGYRGSAYRSGATGRGGFDCSGFMVFLFSREGVSLPRTAAEQFHAGQKVDRTDLRAGDMVFFKNTYKSGISHVGMYIGNGQFVHAANHRLGVKVDALSSSYYANHWAGARRAR